jgi:hypothetical protein
MRGALRLGAWALAVVVVLGPLADVAAQGAKPWRVAFLSAGFPPPAGLASWDTFRTAGARPATWTRS